MGTRASESWFDCV